MKSKTVLVLALGALLCVMTFTAFQVPPAKARNIPILDLSPNQPTVIYGNSLYEVTLTNAVQGDKTAVSFRVSVPTALGSLDLFAWQATFTWDVADLKIDSIVRGTEPAIMVTPGSIIDGVLGTVMYGGACVDRTQKVQVLSGMDLVLFTVIFEVTSSNPPSPLSIFTAPPLVELFGLSDDGNGWPPGTDPWNGIPEFTTYAIWPDVNHDGVINIYDGILFANHWGTYNSAYDFDNDGYVDIFDFAILQADWGKTNTGAHWGDTNTLYGITAIPVVGLGYPGDVNGDGTVDIYDAIILSGAYNSKPGYGNWNPSADINKDGIVDIYDAIILASYYVQPKT